MYAYVCKRVHCRNKTAMGCMLRLLLQVVSKRLVCWQRIWWRSFSRRKFGIALWPEVTPSGTSISLRKIRCTRQPRSENSTSINSTVYSIIVGPKCCKRAYTTAALFFHYQNNRPTLRIIFLVIRRFTLWRHTCSRLHPRQILNLQTHDWKTMVVKCLPTNTTL